MTSQTTTWRNQLSALNRALIISSVEDVHARAVCRELIALKAEGVIVNIADFPQKALSMELVGGKTTLSMGEGPLLSNSYCGVWWRRPQPHLVSEAVLDAASIEFIKSSTRTICQAIALSASSNIINPLGTLSANKPAQLILATSLGFSVPDTLVSNELEAIRRFVCDHSAVCYKTIAPWPYALRETRRITCAELEKLDERQMHVAPTIYQQLIEGPSDLRVTVVGKEIFAVEFRFDDPHSLQVDGRFRNGEFRPVELEEPLRSRLLDFHRASGLVYGAYDFRLGNDGQVYFLEVNPDGQYLFVEIQTGLPISHCIARHLLGRGSC